MSSKVKVTISSERLWMESLPTESETGPAVKDVSGSIKWALRLQSMAQQLSTTSESTHICLIHR